MEQTEKTKELLKENDNHRSGKIIDVVKEQNEKVVAAICKLLEKVQEYNGEYIGNSANSSSSSGNQGYKRKGVCYICQDPGHYAPDCPNKKEKPERFKGYPGNSYTGNQTVAQ